MPRPAYERYVGMIYLLLVCRNGQADVYRPAPDSRHKGWACDQRSYANLSQCFSPIPAITEQSTVVSIQVPRWQVSPVPLTTGVLGHSDQALSLWPSTPVVSGTGETCHLGT